MLAALALLVIAGSLFTYFGVVVPNNQLQAAHQATVSASIHQATVKAMATARIEQTTTARVQMATVQARTTATAQAQLIATAKAQGKPQLLWTFATGDAIWDAPTVVNGVVYVGSTDHKLYAIDAATGQEKWSFTTGDVIEHTSPTVVNGGVDIGCDDHKEFCGPFGAFDLANMTLSQSSSLQKTMSHGAR